MNELVKLALDAHGGLETWKQYSTLSAHLVQGGALGGLKGKAGVLDNVTVTFAEATMGLSFPLRQEQPPFFL